MDAILAPALGLLLDQDLARLWRARRGRAGGVLPLDRGQARLSRAVRIRGYRWMTLRLAKLAVLTTAATWVVMAMVKLVWFIQGSA